MLLGPQTFRSSLFVSWFLAVGGHGHADGGQASGWNRPASPKGVRGNHHYYTVDGEVYEGYLAMPPKGQVPVGAVLVAHQFMGLIDYEKARSDEMAAMGYVAFALDVYGKGKRFSDTVAARKMMALAKSNITKLRLLISAGTKQLVEAYGGHDKLVAMGYCFGGQNVLELARHPGIGASEGVVYKAVSSLHGVLVPLDLPAAPGKIQTWVQAHHAELDPSGDAGLADLETELKAGVNGSDAIWETTKYAKCQHGWTEPGTPVYNARAAVQAQKSTFEFFRRALGHEQQEADAFPIDSFCRDEKCDVTV